MLPYPETQPVWTIEVCLYLLTRIHFLVFTKQIWLQLKSFKNRVPDWFNCRVFDLTSDDPSSNPADVVVNITSFYVLVLRTRNYSIYFSIILLRSKTVRWSDATYSNVCTYVDHMRIIASGSSQMDPVLKKNDVSQNKYQQLNIRSWSEFSKLLSTFATFSFEVSF